MGSNLSTELANGLLDLDLETQIGIQLRSNHYPPVPLTMVQPCINAIDAYNEGDYHREIELPEGVTWRNQITAPASAIIDAHHLREWIIEDEL